MRWLYQAESRPPQTVTEDISFSEEMAWDRPMNLPYTHRARATVTAPKEQTKVNRDFPRLFLGPPPPSLFTIFDAFELNSWDTSPSVEQAGVQIRAAKEPQGSKKGDKKEPPGQIKKFFKEGKHASILGMPRPIPMGAPPWGPEGTPPPFTPEAVFASFTKYENLYRKPQVLRPFEGDQAPLFFGPARQRVDWEAPLSYEFRTRRALQLDYQVEADVPRAEEIFLQWDTPLPYEFRQGRLTLPPLESFVNLQQEEVIKVDSWDVHVKLLPWRPKMPIALFPFRKEQDPPLDEEITLDKYYTRLSEPVRPPHTLRLPVGVLDPEPLPDAPVVPTQIPWWTPLGYEFHRRRIVLPPMETLLREQEVEEILVDKWHSRLPDPVRLPYVTQLWRVTVPAEIPKELVTVDKYESFPKPLPVALRLPIALFPFRKEQDPPADEEITLDKWYQRMADFTGFGLVAPRGADAQIEFNRVATAPWLSAPKVWQMDPYPIPDIPGVTYNYWLTPLGLPVFQGPALPILYQPLQYFPFEVTPPECDRPRRRPDRRTC